MVILLPAQRHRAALAILIKEGAGKECRGGWEGKPIEGGRKLGGGAGLLGGGGQGFQRDVQLRGKYFHLLACSHFFHNKITGFWKIFSLYCRHLTLKDRLVAKCSGKKMKSLPQAAATTVYAAVSPDLLDKSGKPNCGNTQKRSYCTVSIQGTSPGCT